MRENKTLAILTGLMVIGGLGLAVLLVMSWMAYSASLEQFDNVGRSIATLKGEKLAPTPENVQKKEAMVGEYEEAVSRLGTVLLVLQKKVQPMTDTEFQARLKTRSTEIKQTVGGKEDYFPNQKEFAFGFETYNSSLPRSAEVATELGDYLGAVDEIVKMFIDVGVEKIDSLERSELSIEKGAPPPPPPPVKETKKPSSKKSKAAAGKKVAPPKEITKVVERRQVRTTLTADQGALQMLMNKLASPSQMPFFTIVRQVRIENEKQEGPLRGSIVSAAPEPAPTPTEPATAPASEPAPAPTAPATAPVAATAATPAAPGAAAPAPLPEPVKPRIIEPAKPLTPDAQAVFGEEKLKVYLEIDLVRFLDPAATAAAK